MLESEWRFLALSEDIIKDFTSASRGIPEMLPDVRVF